MLSSHILNIFGESPIKPMQKHMKLVAQCVEQLSLFIDAAISGNWQKADEQQKIINGLEEEADDLKKNIRLHLPNHLFMPFNRSDLLGLLTSQDKLAGKAKHIANLIYNRQMQFPEQIKQDYIEFLQCCIQATQKAKKVIYELDELVEAGFKGREVQFVIDKICQLDTIERDADQRQMKVRNKLFAIEKEYDPVDIIFLYKIIDWTGELADRAQHVGHRLETLLAQ